MEKPTIHQPDAAETQKDTAENWWEYCPLCGSKMFNRKCRYLCANPKCNFFMSCSEFDG